MMQTSKARLAAAVQQSMQHNVNHWAVAEVCDWCDYIGLGQYRKKFVHHCIDGRLLLGLSDRDLKVSHSARTHSAPPTLFAGHSADFWGCMQCGHFAYTNI